ncbi:MAG TPA: hypothetical protein VFN48_11745 [Solirubrobacteraceae bacterium]|nr:hypothetical protein [Solirubrobacteraceae bacterium]
MAVLLMLLLDLVILHERGVSGDEPFYMAMARHPGRPHNFPYAYRVAIPWLVHVLPFPQVVGFTILGVLAVAISAAALFLLLDAFDVPHGLSLGLCVGFTLSPVLWVVVVRHFRNVDPASVMVMILGALFIVRRRRIALGLTLLFGIGVHESTLFLIPLTYAVWATRLADPSAAADTARVGLLPAVVYLILRARVPAVDAQDIQGYAGSFLQARWSLLSHVPLGVELKRLAYTYGPVWPAAVAGLRSSAFARRGLVLVGLCLAAMTYATDWNRVMFFAAPVLYVAAGVALRRRPRLAMLLVVALLATDLGYGIYLQTGGVVHGIDHSISHVPVV